MHEPAPRKWVLKLGDVATGRDNNLDIMRLIAACMVIASHSFALLYGADVPSKDPLSIVTDELLSMGGFAVGVFFLFGGYLIAKSCETSRGTVEFYRKRAMRIFPELIIVIAAITFIVGPLLTRLPIDAYFLNPETYLYLKNIVLIPTHSLPGVFANAPYPNVVNGSLWTLPVEFVCYVLVYLSYRFTAFDKRKYAIHCTPFIALTSLYFVFLHPFQLSVVRAILLFWIGATLYVYRDLIPYDRRLYMLSIPFFFVLLALKLSTLAMLIFFPMGMFFLAYDIKGMQRESKRTTPHKKIELSYGVYLWGWPVGQSIIHFFPNIDVFGLIASTLLASFVLALITNLLSNLTVSKIRSIRS